MATFLLLAAASGCSTTPRQFSFTGFDAARAERLAWPPIGEGEIPRFSYLGDLVGESNFVKDKTAVEFSLADVVTLLVGALSGEKPPTLLARPLSGAVDPFGRVLVTDFARRSIFVFSEKDGRLEEWTDAAPERRFLTPVGIAVTEKGDFFVADSEAAFVARLDKDGKPSEPIGIGQLMRPTGVAYDATTARLYVADTQAHHIKIFDLSGQLLDIWGDQGEEIDRAVGRASADDLLLNWPTYLAVAKGKLFVTDTMNARVVVISTETGRQLSTIGTRGTFVGNMVRPKGVAVDGEENVYVVEGYHDHLLIYNREGQFLMAIGGEGEAPGQFLLPNGVWIDQGQRVFVADTHNSRVQVFQFLGGDSPDED